MTRRFNQKLPWVKCPGKKPIAVAFNDQYNIEVYSITDFCVDMATPDGNSREYVIQHDSYGYKYIIYKGSHIRLSKFIAIG